MILTGLLSRSGSVWRKRFPAAAVGVLLLTLSSQAASAEWQAAPGHRWRNLEVASGARAGFTSLPAARTGLNFTNQLEEWNGAANRVLLNGSGVAVGDFDGDGRPDIFLCGLDSPNALFRNLGQWRFTNVTAAAGLHFTGRFHRAAVFADVNGDGRPDLLVSATGRGVACYLNNGDGTFRDATPTAGTASAYGSVGMALADVDGNGTLDLYICNNRTEDIRDRGQVSVQVLRGEVVTPAFKDRLRVAGGELQEYGEPDQLFLNDGSGRFTEVSWTGGAFLDEEGNPLQSPPRDWGLAATFRDVNGDGLPDLYVCNDFWTPDRFWINQGGGRFRALDLTAWRSMSASSMGVDFADLNRDGFVDFLVVDMLSRDPRLRKRQMLAQKPEMTFAGADTGRPQLMRNTLFENRGDGTFAEIAHYAGLAASDWSWCPLFLDVDLDGWEDVLISAGHAKDVQDLDAEQLIRSRQRSYRDIPDELERRRAFTHDKMINERLYPRLDMPVVAFRNLGDFRFRETTAEWGTDRPGIYHGMAAGDFDGDGDLDLVVSNLGAAVSIFRNDATAPRVAIRLKGAAPNTQGIGARVRLRGGAVPMQSQEVVAGGRYESGSDPQLVFAAGSSERAMSVEVLWRSGRVTILTNLLANRLYEIDESSSAPPAPSPALVTEPLFEDVSARLAHRHQEDAWDDFALQSLLPERLSRFGPGVVWFDVNGDGAVDLTVGAGRGGRMETFLGDGQGGFRKWEPPGSLAALETDTAGMAGWIGADGGRALMVGLAWQDPTTTNRASLKEITAQGMKTIPASTQVFSSLGPLCLADMNGDGKLELFAGARFDPGRYPLASGSRVYRQGDSGWMLDATNSAALAGAGMVSGAVWSDLTGDGFPELVLACDWGPVRVFANERGRLREATTELGLGRHLGRWQGVATADVDGDGDLDIVAGNWGLNSETTASFDRPAQLVFGEFRQPGVVDLIETEFVPALGGRSPRRLVSELAPVLPFLVARYSSHRAYSETTLADFLGPHAERSRAVQATTFATTLFLNEGGRFVARELPREAQLAPVFGVVVEDFDGDGHADIFLAQNFSATRTNQEQLNAGRGLLLRGDGTGRFTAVAASISGLAIHGDQRGAAAADFDRDGRVDLVVAQNAGETRLFRNRLARSGLRVRLAGPAGNPEAAGSQLRLLGNSGSSRLQEITAGGGYWSQNDSTVVLPRSDEDARLWIRWPGGRTNVVALPAGAATVTIDAQGQIIPP